jgi:hypothetical protein
MNWVSVIKVWVWALAGAAKERAAAITPALMDARIICWLLLIGLWSRSDCFCRCTRASISAHEGAIDGARKRAASRCFCLERPLCLRGAGAVQLHEAVLNEACARFVAPFT